MKNHEQQQKIIVKGARTHNLKNITVEMPRNKMIVFSGLSGSGKSSLAFESKYNLSRLTHPPFSKSQKPEVVLAPKIHIIFSM